MKPKLPLDAQTTIADLRREIDQFVSERHWEPYHSPKNLGMSIAIEAAEIMEHFQWLSEVESRERMRDEALRGQVADELADVIIYCLGLANQADIDISAAVRSKLDRNRGRFPVGYMPT